MRQHLYNQLHPFHPSCKYPNVSGASPSLSLSELGGSTQVPPPPSLSINLCFRGNAGLSGTGGSSMSPRSPTSLHKPASSNSSSSLKVLLYYYIYIFLIIKIISIIIIIIMTIVLLLILLLLLFNFLIMIIYIAYYKCIIYIYVCPLSRVEDRVAPGGRWPSSSSSSASPWASHSPFS